MEAQEAIQKLQNLIAKMAKTDIEIEDGRDEHSVHKAKRFSLSKMFIDSCLKEANAIADKLIESKVMTEEEVDDIWGKCPCPHYNLPECVYNLVIDFSTGLITHLETK